MVQRQGDEPTFAFLVHPRDISDIHRRFSFTRYVPARLLERALECAAPVLVGTVRGLSRTENERANGIIISVPMTARRMLANRRKARKKLDATILYARRHGARYIGLGSLTSPIASGGEDVAGKTDIFFTNGNALTAAMSLEGIKRSAAVCNINLPDATIAIIGATGSVGWAISKGLVSDLGAHHILLVGRTQKNLETLKEDISRDHPSTAVEISLDIASVSTADMVVVATSGSGTLIHPEHLKQGALVYDITQPQNIHPRVKAERPDVFVVDGAIAQLPVGCAVPTSLGLPQGTVFSCLAETMIVAAEDKGNDFSIGKVTGEHVKYIGQRAAERGFTLAPLTAWGKPITR